MSGEMRTALAIVAVFCGYALAVALLVGGPLVLAMWAS